MYDRSYGAKYDEPGKYARVADIAKLIRRDIKAAIAAGELPGRISDYRVRSESYSGGQSIRVRLLKPELYEVCKGIVPGSDDDGYGRFCGDPWCAEGGIHRDAPHARYHYILSAEGRRVEEKLKEIHGAFNHDGSEPQVDYFDRRYWGGVEIERPSERPALAG